MSFFGSIKLFFESLWHEVTGGSAPNVLHKALVGINLVEPLLVLAIQDADPEYASEVQSIVDEVRTDMTDLSDLIATNPTTAGAGNTTVQARLAAGLAKINANIGALLKAGHIKNPTLIHEITAGLNELEVVVASLPAAMDSATASIPGTPATPAPNLGVAE